MAISKLPASITEKVNGQPVEASEWNAATAKENEIIDELNVASTQSQQALDSVAQLSTSKADKATVEAQGQKLSELEGELHPSIIMSIAGNDYIGISKDVHFVQGHIYKLVPSKRSWSIGHITPSSVVFELNCNGTIIQRVRQNEMALGATLRESFIVEPTTSLTLFMRADEGEIIDFDIIDVTEITRLSNVETVLRKNLITARKSYTLIGNGASTITQAVLVEPNVAYKLIPRTRLWNHASISSSSSLFWLTIDGVSAYDKKGTTGLDEYYDITSSSNYILINIRADIGEKVTFELVDEKKTMFDIRDQDIIARTHYHANGQGSMILDIPLNATGGKYYTLKLSKTSWNRSSVTVGQSLFWLTIDGVDAYEAKQFPINSSYSIYVEHSASVHLRADYGETIELELIDESSTMFDLIGIADKGDILSLHPDETMRPILANLKRRKDSFGIEDDRFTIMYFGDLHSRGDVLQRYKKFRDHYAEYIDAVVCAGDCVDRYDNPYDFWSANGADFLNVVGNHETLRSTSTPLYVDGVQIKVGVAPMFSPKQVYDKFFNDYVATAGYTITENKCYWYKDYDAKIRIIGLDWMHWKDRVTLVDNTTVGKYSDDVPCDTGQQEQWLIDTLADARAKDMSVVCVMHSPYKMETEDCPFTSLDFANRLYWSNEEAAQCVQDFIDAGGKFVMWLTGHLHQDVIGVCKNYPQQPMMSIETSRLGFNPNGDNEKIAGTNSNDCFDIVSIDTTKQLFSVFRVGTNYDRYGRLIESLVYDYGNKKMIYK